MRRSTLVMIGAIVVVLLAYLITRPHLGTQYVGYMGKSALPKRWASSQQCEENARQINSGTDLWMKDSSYFMHCEPKTALLWGW